MCCLNNHAPFSRPDSYICQLIFMHLSLGFVGHSQITQLHIISLATFVVSSGSANGLLAIVRFCDGGQFLVFRIHTGRSLDTVLL